MSTPPESGTQTGGTEESGSRYLSQSAFPPAPPPHSPPLSRRHGRACIERVRLVDDVGISKLKVRKVVFLPNERPLEVEVASIGPAYSKSCRTLTQ